MPRNKNDVLKELNERISDIQGAMRKLFRAENSNIAVIHGSLQLAQECVFQNFFQKNDEILIVGEGYSALQLQCMAKLSQLSIHSIKVSDELPLNLIKEQLSIYPQIKAVLLPLVESSNGTLYRLNGLAELLKEADVLLMVSVDDTLLMNSFPFDEMEVDIALSTLMNQVQRGPFSFVALSHKACRKLLKQPRHFLCLKQLYSLDKQVLEKEIVSFDSYLEVARILHLMTYYEMWQWNHYFGALTTYLRNSIRQLGYFVLSTRHYSNSHILIKLLEEEDAYYYRSKIYEYTKLVCDVLEDHLLLINMNRFMHIFDTLKLIEALAKLKDTCKDLK